jgi:ATP-dependent RNA helicase RhlE
MLVDLLRGEPIDRALIFTRTKHGADKVVRGLARAGIGAEAIHGNKSQNQRERVLAAFRNGQLRTLIATDIAARGIDVDGISHVVNLDLPHVPETYVHRIGRTARAGAQGVAISLCDGEDVALLRDIEKLIRMTIPVAGGFGGQRSAQPSPARAAMPAPVEARTRHRHRDQPVRKPERHHRAEAAAGHFDSVAFMQRGDRPAGNRAPRPQRRTRRSKGA